MDTAKIAKMFSLEGKVALVTGGGRGIGRAVALGFADAGADIALASRKLPELEKVAEEIKAKHRKAFPIAAHVAKKDELKNLVDKVVAEFGHIDILMNNAGTNPAVSPLIDAEDFLWETDMNVNLRSIFWLGQMVAKVMVKQGKGGSIINTASVGGLRPSNLQIYGISKAGVIMLTQSMAREWGQYNIRANAIAPGTIKTRLSEMLWRSPAAGEAAINRTPLHRLGEPEDLVGACLYLASDAASFVTGITVIVDGGAMVGPPPQPKGPAE